MIKKEQQTKIDEAALWERYKKLAMQGIKLGDKNPENTSPIVLEPPKIGDPHPKDPFSPEKKKVQ